MQRHTHALFLRACALVALVPLAATAAADPAQDANRAAARALFRPENAIGAQAPSDIPLAQQRGGTDTRNDMRLAGSVAANTAVNVVTGTNSIDAGSFANMAGIPVVIQNSGANVLIQNATIINLQLK
jgi:hypothetical protein